MHFPSQLHKISLIPNLQAHPKQRTLLLTTCAPFTQDIEKKETRPAKQAVVPWLEMLVISTLHWLWIFQHGIAVIGHLQELQLSASGISCIFNFHELFYTNHGGHLRQPPRNQRLDGMYRVKPCGAWPGAFDFRSIVNHRWSLMIIVAQHMVGTDQVSTTKF